MTRHVLTAVVLCCATAFAAIRPALAAEPSGDAKPRTSRPPYQFNVQKCNLKTAEGVCSDAVPSFEITTRKKEDRVQATLKGDQALFVITSPSGIGSATIQRTAASWPKKIVVRAHLRGLESLSVSNGKVRLSASVLSHGNHMRLLHLGKAGKEKKVQQGSPYGMEIKIVDAAGEPIRGLPGPGGYFEMTLPGALLEGNPKSLTLGWIDFYRG